MNNCFLGLDETEIEFLKKQGLSEEEIARVKLIINMIEKIKGVRNDYTRRNCKNVCFLY